MTIELLDGLSPGLLVIFGALLVPLLPGLLRKLWLLALPVLVFLYVLELDSGQHGIVAVFDLELTTLRVDRLSLIFGYIFLLALWLGVIYQHHLSGWMEQVAGLIYAGSAIGAVFAGDLVTLFLFWEGTAIASVFLIWASRTEAAYSAGMRYLIIQVGSGVLLLAGTMIHYSETGSIAFDSFDIETTAGLVIFLAFGIKCAFPLLHNWLQDAYPQATPTGTVMLSAFTTKLAVYSLARGFAGTEILVPIGATMAVFPIFYAVIENDLRRVLAYSLNNQLGFMVVGIGIGTELAISGAAAQAFCHILYKALLFMSMGAVLYRVGTVKGSELGGLYRTMPWTTAFCILGALSISAPLFGGFVSKSLVLSAALKGEYFWTWLVLLFASAGVFLVTGLKVPYVAFFGRDARLRPREAPGNMLVAMGVTAALCLAIGLFPDRLYAILPHDVSYHPYTLEHVVTQLQLLIFSALAFTVLMRTGLYPPELRSTNLDTDWVYRIPGRAMARAFEFAWFAAYARMAERAFTNGQRALAELYRLNGSEGVFGRTRPSGFTALWMTVLLTVSLVLAFI